MLVIFCILILSPEFKLCGSSVVIVITGDEYDAPIIIFGFLSWIVFDKSPVIIPGLSIVVVLLSWRTNPATGGLAFVASFGIT